MIVHSLSGEIEHLVEKSLISIVKKFPIRFSVGTEKTEFVVKRKHLTTKIPTGINMIIGRIDKKRGCEKYQNLIYIIALSIFNPEEALKYRRDVDSMRKYTLNLFKSWTNY